MSLFFSRRLSCRLALAAALAAVWLAPALRGAGQGGAEQYRPPGNPPPAGSAAPSGAAREAANPDASQNLLREAQRRLRAVGPLDAKIRQRVQMYGQQVVGSGRYRQSGPDAPLMTRLDMKLQIGDQVVSYQQVFDSQLLWTRRDQGDRVDLTRADFGRRQELLANSPELKATLSLQSGLPRLLEAVAQRYDLGAPQTDTMSGQAVWRLRGKRLDRPGAAPADDRRHPSLPPPLVEIFIGKDPLFPYRVAFLDEVVDAASNERRLQPVMLVELYEVEFRAPLSPEAFQFDPGELEFRDTTQPQPQRPEPKTE